MGSGDKFYKVHQAASAVAVIGYTAVTLLICCGGGYFIWAVLQ